jgi:hypothetical protein
MDSQPPPSPPSSDETVSEKIVLDAVQDIEIQKKLIIATSLALPWVLYSEVYVIWKGCWALRPEVAFAESLAYTVMLAMVLLSALHKYLTGSGLPAGPKGLLGICEGGAYALTGVLALEMLHFYFTHGFASICSAV